MNEILKASQIGYQTEKQTILKEIDLSVYSDSFLTLTGVSGGGKSTFLKILASLVSPTTGKITFHGEDVETLEPTSYRQKVSYAFQQPVLFGENVYDNLRFPFDIRKEVISETQMVALLEEVELTAAFLSKQVTELSGGEKQRVALLRNLMFQPEILLLDEVTVGLDEESKRVVNQLIKKKNEEGVAIIRVTHDSDELQQSQKIMYITGGELHE